MFTLVRRWMSLFEQNKDYVSRTRQGFSQVAKDIRSLNLELISLKDSLENMRKKEATPSTSLEVSALQKKLQKTVEDISFLYDEQNAANQLSQKVAQKQFELESNIVSLEKSLSIQFAELNKSIGSLTLALKYAQISSNIAKNPRLDASKRESENEMSDSELTSNGVEINAVKPYVPVTVRQIAYKLTAAEKEILTILMSTNQKLSYKDIAVNYERSISTVKNTICRLKNKGIQLQEQSSSDGMKRYFLEDNYKRILLSQKI